MLKEDLLVLKSFIAESLNPQTMSYIYWEEWWDIVKQNMANEPSWNPDTEEKRAHMCYNSGYTPDEFEEEWLSSAGLL